MRALFPAGNLVRIVAEPPAIECLPGHSEMTEGEGGVTAVLEIVDHPLQARLGRSAQRLPPSNLHGHTLSRMSPVILNENNWIGSAVGLLKGGLAARSLNKRE
jgi:hypothetical protein